MESVYCVQVCMYQSMYACMRVHIHTGAYVCACINAESINLPFLTSSFSLPPLLNTACSQKAALQICKKCLKSEKEGKYACTEESRTGCNRVSWGAS